MFVYCVSNIAENTKWAWKYINAKFIYISRNFSAHGSDNDMHCLNTKKLILYSTLITPRLSHFLNSQLFSKSARPKCSTKVLDKWRGMVLLNLINLIFRWSFGCLLAEVLSGTKMFSATDKMASVLKPHQLLEMRLGATEMQYDEKGHQTFFSDAKDLIMK